MTRSTVDSKQRMVLPGVRPGDIFDVQHQADGSILLVRLEKPELAPRMPGC
jgi:hypothetical protein